MVRFLLILLASLSLMTAGSGCRKSGPLDLAALEGQARGGDSAAIEKMVAILADPALAERVYPVILDLGEAAVPSLLELARSEAAQPREYAVAALGTLKAQRAVPLIRAILADRQLERRYVAAWALGEIGGTQSITALINALDDDNFEVRRRATRALIKLHTPAVMPMLRKLPSAPPRATEAIIHALGDIADTRSLDALLDLAEGQHRAAAFLALGKLRDPRAEAALIAGLSDPAWEARMNAAMALGPLGRPAAVSDLRKALNDEVVVVREWAARSLEMITGQRTLYRGADGEIVPPDNLYH